MIGLYHKNSELVIWWRIWFFFVCTNDMHGVLGCFTTKFSFFIHKKDRITQSWFFSHGIYEVSRRTFQFLKLFVVLVITAFIMFISGICDKWWIITNFGNQPIYMHLKFGMCNAFMHAGGGVHGAFVCNATIQNTTTTPLSWDLNITEHTEEHHLGYYLNSSLLFLECGI